LSRSIAIVTDSTADLPPDLARERGIAVVPLTVTLDGRSYLDGVDMTPARFYSLLASSTGHPTTSQPSPGLFAETYARLLRDHDEVLSLHISAKLSGTYASARGESGSSTPRQSRCGCRCSLSARPALPTTAEGSTAS